MVRKFRTVLGKSYDRERKRGSRSVQWIDTLDLSYVLSFAPNVT